MKDNQNQFDNQDFQTEFQGQEYQAITERIGEVLRHKVTRLINQFVKYFI
ncbi:unnamed protein product [Paramecium octaurelia]|uniref:Uncharacterized protein n=1 Tax=Paramecium octaurelia TaxID=43137 RepID=A0A8S1VPE8_PAROT|nr:unnamed protein product [Paramecium octaurelia]